MNVAKLAEMEHTFLTNSFFTKYIQIQIVYQYEKNTYKIKNKKILDS